MANPFPLIIIPSLHCLRLSLPYHLLAPQLWTHLSLPYAKLSGHNMTQFVFNPPFQLKPYKTLTNQILKIREMKENQSVKMEKLPLRIGFPFFPFRIG